jgi:hypothetical protein
VVSWRGTGGEIVPVATNVLRGLGLTVSGLLARARANGRRVRAFGEMVALLWEQGHHSATVRLEPQWGSFCRRETFPLFCACLMKRIRFSFGSLIAFVTIEVSWPLPV